MSSGDDAGDIRADGTSSMLSEVIRFLSRGAASQTTSVGLGEKTGKPFDLERSFRDEVIKHYNQARTNTNDSERPTLYHVYDRTAPRGSAYLNSSAQTLSYVVLHGRRITPRSASGIVKASLDGFPYAAGEVLRLLLHEQHGFPPQVFAEIAWMVPAKVAELEGDNNPWRDQ